MSQIKLPGSIRAASKQLTSLDGLVTAKEWERAAIVFAFTEPQQGRRTSRRTAGSQTIAEFAGLGIAGLRSDNTVRRYRTAWQTLVQRGTVAAVQPGDTVALPDLPFPPDFEVKDDDRRQALTDAADAEGAGHRSTQQIATHLPALRAAIKADPKVAAAASQALDERVDLRQSRPAPEDKPETNRDAHADATALMIKLRSAHRALADAAVYAQNVRGLGAGELREGVLHEVDWIRGVCDVLEAGANGGPLDSQLQDLLDSEAGR